VADRFRLVVVGNVQLCRTEAEVYLIGLSGERLIGVAYETSQGWKLDPVEWAVGLSPESAAAALAAAQERLKGYVNRRGDSPPPGLSAAGLSLWLMEKTDGTAMGTSIR
jgi:hypothetical protein